MKRLLLLLAVALVLSACSVSLKQKVVLGLQINHTTLTALDDTELLLYRNKTIPALTEQRHKDISVALAKAYRAEIKATEAMKAWRASDPAPASISELIGVANEAFLVAAQIVPQLAGKTQAEQDLVVRLVRWLNQIKDIAALVKLPVPAFVG